MSEDEIILTHILKCKPVDLILKKPALNCDQKKQCDDYKNRRIVGEPLQYILGTCNFMGLEFKVNPSVLVPRPETEQLVDAALKVFKKGKALDLGTGAGNIAVALAKFVPGSHIVSVDASAQALKVACENARAHQVKDRIEFIQENFERILKKDTRLFNLVISNPPYIQTSQLKFLPKDVQQEPKSALDGGEDGLKFLAIIIKYSPSLLREGGYLMMEFGDGQAGAIKKLIEAQKAFSNIEIIKDLAGRERIVKAWKSLSLKAASL